MKDFFFLNFWFEVIDRAVYLQMNIMNQHSEKKEHHTYTKTVYNK